MKPGQKLYDNNGVQVALFPLEYLYMSQDEGGDYSHKGTLNMDFLGWGANGRIYRCPIYAPCDMKCIKQSNSGDHDIWQSLRPVHWADGSIEILTMVVAHDNMPPPVGSLRNQGDLLGHTGTRGQVTGDHTHINVALGIYRGWHQVPPNGNYELQRSMHIYDAFFVNDTVIKRGFGHPWRIYKYIPPTPVEFEGKKPFPWVLYSNKLRNRVK